MKLYLIRHGESENNQRKYWSGWYDTPLTYLASLLTSLVYFLRFLLRVLALFGRQNRRR